MPLYSLKAYAYAREGTKHNGNSLIKGVLRRFRVFANILLWKSLSWLYGAFMGLLWVFGGVLVVGGVWWGVSIMREWGNSKANPPKKHKKNLTRELKKPILHLGGVKNFYEEIKKNIFISIGKYKFEWMWGK